MKRISKNLLIIGGMLSLMLFTTAPVSASPATYMAQGNPACARGFLTLPVWYRGLTQGSTNCELDIDGNPNFVWIIGLNVVEMLMHVVGYVSAIFVLIGGFRYVTSTGEPDRITSAKKTVTSAITGLLIALVAIAAINFIVSQVAR